LQQLPLILAPAVATVAAMDTTRSRSKMPRRLAATKAPGTAKGCALSRNKLTLATFVIAVVGFAGTAFAAAPLDCAVQAPATVSASR
jgi:hypothetical protein